MPTRKLISSRTDLDGIQNDQGAADNAGDLEGPQVGLDHLSHVKCLKGEPTAQDITDDVVRGVSPAFLAIGDQVDPDNPEKVVIDETRAVDATWLRVFDATRIDPGTSQPYLQVEIRDGIIMIDGIKVVGKALQITGVTSGLSLSELEVQVNELKELLLEHGLSYN